MSRAWFAYTGPAGGELRATNYTHSVRTPTCFEGTPNICAVYGVYAPERYGLAPAPFSTNLIAYIAGAKITTSAQPIGNGGTKKYVYTYPVL